MRRKILLVALAAGLVAARISWAEERTPEPSGTWLKVAMTTGEEYSRDPKTVFTPDAPAIYAVYRIVAAGPAKLKAVFIADAAEGLDPKTRLLEKVISISSSGEFMGAVPAMKPPNGWPVGAYRVEFYLGDVLSKTLPFKVEKRTPSP
ncbi:MAG: hypothetical protein ABI584_06835 [Acidobacteriota bacterium]